MWTSSLECMLQGTVATGLLTFFSKGGVAMVTLPRKFLVALNLAKTQLMPETEPHCCIKQGFFKVN